MKEIIKIAAAAIFAALLASCATTKVEGSGIKGKSAKVKTPKAEIVDYQGATFGSEIPEWVVQISDGQYSRDALSPYMPGLEKKKVFIVIASGDNLDFVKQWTDLVEVEVQVGDTMQRIVGKAVSASQKARQTQTGKNSDPTEMERELNMYKEAVSAVEVNGLEKAASYWIEKIVRGKDKKEKDSFEYYTVWTMDQEKFDRQLDASMKNISDNTSEGAELKKALREKLTGTTVSSNYETLETQ